MGLFEDVVVNARSAANVVGKKAGQLVDISKLRLSAADVEREISARLAKRKQEWMHRLLLKRALTVSTSYTSSWMLSMMNWPWPGTR